MSPITSVSAPRTLGTVAEHPAHDRRRPRPLRVVRADRPTPGCPSISDGPRGAELAADDDRRGVQRVAEIAECLSDGTARVLVTRSVPGSSRPASSSSPVDVELAAVGPVAASPESAVAEATVSRQPRLPQRQTTPSGRTWTCPISPACPSTPRCNRPPRTIPAPIPGRDLDVDQSSWPRAGAERMLARGAEVRVVVDVDVDIEPRGRTRRPASSPTQPGRITEDRTRAGRAGRWGPAGPCRRRSTLLGSRTRLREDFRDHRRRPCPAHARPTCRRRRRRAVRRAPWTRDPPKRDAQVAVAEVDADARHRHAGSAAAGSAGGRWPGRSGRGSTSALDDDAVGLPAPRSAW